MIRLSIIGLLLGVILDLCGKIVNYETEMGNINKELEQIEETINVESL